MERNEKTISEVILGGFCRFILSALFGGFISVVLFFIMIYFGIDGFFQSNWKHSLWIIPLCWGVIGIFWFENSLSIARDIVEGFSDRNRYR
jgi:membrane protein DedA with SNARE-associated domain